MLRPSPNHGTQRLPNDDDDDDESTFYIRPDGFPEDLLGYTTCDACDLT